MPYGFEKQKEVTVVLPSRNQVVQNAARKELELKRNTSLTRALKGPPEPYSRTLKLTLSLI